MLINGLGAVPSTLGPLPWAKLHEELNLKEIYISLPSLGRSEKNFGATKHADQWPRTDVEPILEAEGITDKQKIYAISLSAGPRRFAFALPKNTAMIASRSQLSGYGVGATQYCTR